MSVRRAFCTFSRQLQKSKGLVHPAEIDSLNTVPTITVKGAAFQGDLRSTSGLGLGDGKTTHTSKWMQVRWATVL